MESKLQLGGAGFENVDKVGRREAILSQNASRKRPERFV